MMVQFKQKRGTGVKTPSPRNFWCGTLATHFKSQRPHYQRHMYGLDHHRLTHLYLNGNLVTKVTSHTLATHVTQVTCMRWINEDSLTCT